MDNKKMPDACNERAFKERRVKYVVQIPCINGGDKEQTDAGSPCYCATNIT